MAKQKQPDPTPPTTPPTPPTTPPTPAAGAVAPVAADPTPAEKRRALVKAAGGRERTQFTVVSRSETGAPTLTAVRIGRVLPSLSADTIRAATREGAAVRIGGVIRVEGELSGRVVDANGQPVAAVATRIDLPPLDGTAAEGVAADRIALVDDMVLAAPDPVKTPAALPVGQDTVPGGSGK